MLMKLALLLHFHIFVEIQVLKYTQLQKKVGVLQESKLRGKSVLLNSLHELFRCFGLAQFVRYNRGSLKPD